MSKKMILSGLVGAAVTAGAGFAAWVGSPIFDGDDFVALPMQGSDYVHQFYDVADFDQDGFDDLVVKGINSDGDDRVMVFLNQSGDGFNLVFEQNTTASYRAADVNGDGYPDLIQLPNGTGTAYVLINQLAILAACPSDLDKTGATEIGDLLFVIDRWGACEEG